MCKKIWGMMLIKNEKWCIFKIAFCILMCFVTMFSSLISYAFPDVSAKSAIVIENSTGKIIYEKNAYQKLPMASTTKIMTALCAVENSDIKRFVEVSDEAVGIEGSSIYLAQGEIISVEDLIYATLLNSGNDAATALACEISGNVENFAKLMNATAKKIGAKNTNFVNASGLWEENHYTTAYDLALISAYALNNPVFAEAVKTKEKTISNGNKPYKRSLKNHNKLLSMYEGCIGVKTGYTKKCGRCLVSAAKRNGVTLTCVTLNAPDDWSDHTKMLDYGFSKVKYKNVAQKGEYALSVNVSGGEKKICGLEFEDLLGYVDTGDEKVDIDIEFDCPKNVKAPVYKGVNMGRVNLLCNGKVVDSCVLLCSEQINEKKQEKKSESSFMKNLKRFVSF